MPFLIDTNIAIHARDGNEAVLVRLLECEDAVLLSALSLAELERGVYKDPSNSALRKRRLGVLLSYIPVLPFTAEAAEAYGAIIAACGWVRGRDFDRMIAAHAIACGATLVTNNLEDFRDIPGLAIENWVTSCA